MYRIIRALVFLTAFAAAFYAQSLTGPRKITIAVWGDSRENLDNACVEIADVLLHKMTGWDFQIHNGDFTHHGRAEDWQRTLHYRGIDSLYVRGRFYMCTSNHDAEPPDVRPVYDRNTADVLPVNSTDGTTHFYAVEKGNVHIFFCDGYFTPAEVMQRWLDSSLALVPDSDWVIGVWHNPAYDDISYKEGYMEKCGGWLRSIARHGRGFIINGHAHIYVRTKPLDPDGTPDDDHGLVNIVNGTGGASWKDPAPHSEKVAFTPQGKSFPCIAFLTFEGQDVSLTTVDARPESNLNVIDSWSWHK
jgi:predicted phosphodiesterase